jgi:transcriptional regulator with XRE-family HTH domain
VYFSGIMSPSSPQDILPARLRRSLEALGANIGIARKRRGLTAAMMAERIGVGRDTYSRIERGNPGVSLSSYAMALFVLGVEPRFAELIDPRTDNVGARLDLDRLPKRVRPVRHPQPK